MIYIKYIIRQNSVFFVFIKENYTFIKWFLIRNQMKDILQSEASKINVGGYVMKEVVLNEFIKERIKENEVLFNKQECDIINNNRNLIKKIYILGVKDGKEI